MVSAMTNYPLPGPSPRASMDQVDEYWLENLPCPRDFLPETDDNVAEFLREVFRVGGIAALEWVWVPRSGDAGNWPFTPNARGRMGWFHTQLLERANNQVQRERERAARERIEDAEQARRERRRAAGWA